MSTLWPYNSVFIAALCSFAACSPIPLDSTSIWLFKLSRILEVFALGTSHTVSSPAPVLSGRPLAPNPLHVSHRQIVGDIPISQHFYRHAFSTYLFRSYRPTTFLPCPSTGHCGDRTPLSIPPRTADNNCSKKAFLASNTFLPDNRTEDIRDAWEAQLGHTRGCLKQNIARFQ